MLAYEEKFKYQNELMSNENLLWSGHPHQGLILRNSDLYQIPFSIIWTGFAVFWTVGVTSTSAPPCVGLWGTMFIVVGLYNMVGRFFFDSWQRRHTQYLVTNERVLIISSTFKRDVRSFSLRALFDITLNTKGNGEGTLTFGPTINRRSQFPGQRRDITPCFEQIENARHVYEIIQQAQRQFIPVEQPINRW